MVTLNVAHITDRDGSAEMGPDTQQVAWEHAQMMRLFDQRQPRRILEIGSYHGGTLHYWIDRAPVGSVIVSVDDQAVHADQWHRWSIDRGSVLHVIKGNSQSPAIIDLAWQYAPYEWIFIDADHRYTGVSSDWQQYGAMVKRGGVIVFHDIVERNTYGVHQLWREIQAQGHVTQELVAVPSWCGIGVVYAP